MSIEWAAGLFEGEGCIYIEQNRYVRLVLSSTDRDVLDRFQSVFGGSIYFHKGKAAEGRRALNHKPLWAWRMGRAADVEVVLRAILPHMGKRRSAKIHEALGVLKALA